jgi:sarcosine oxidase subunit beta
MTERADLVIVGAGAIGGWASWFSKTEGAGRVVVLERGLAGLGASTRAAGVVRAQGGMPATVALGRWSIDFYRRQPELLGTDSGFRELGYLILAQDEADEQAAQERIAMQREAGLPVRWLDAHETAVVSGTLAEGGYRGASYVESDGCVDPGRNVRAYSLAMQAAGVELRERTAFTGLRTTRGSDGRWRVVGVDTTGGPIETERVLLTGGPSLREVGRLAGIRIPVGMVRHTVAVSEPHAAFAERQPMVFDIAAGLYWRLEEDGLLFGWSNPDEGPGEAREIDWAYYEWMRSRLAALVPVTRDLGIRKIWAATIEFVSDHLPIIGPGLTDGGEAIEGLTVATASGHGMMWGPGVARVAADLVLTGATEVCDVSELGLDRFDERGRSRHTVDPIALPFPVSS